MFYYWLVPILILGIIAIGVIIYSSRRKSETSVAPQTESPDAIKRGEHLNE